MGWRAAAVAAAVLLALTGCGGADDGGSAGGDLVWAEEPRVFTPENLPRDRILSGEVRNDSLRRVEIDAAELRLLDPSGRRVKASAIFLNTYAHQLFPPTREPPGGIPEEELIRLGVKARIDPGKTVPLTVSWRQPRGDRAPVRIEAGGSSLALPGR